MLSAALGVLLAAAPSAEALEVLKRHECHRCHEVEGLAPMPVQASCAGCHRDLASTAGDAARTRDGLERYGKTWERFVTRSSQHYQHVPPLAGMGRLRGAWLERFFEAPHDVRPHLTESMFRANLAPAEVDALLRGWGAASEPPPSPVPDAATVEAGRALFVARGCQGCHALGNLRFPQAKGVEPKGPAWARAPDLRHARQRLSPATAAAFIQNPQAVLPGAVMPPLGVGPEDAARLAAFVFHADVGPPAKAAPPKLPAWDAKAKVPGYEEVERRVFKDTCWHCHSNPDFADGDGGPGNTGGFGFPAGGLSFASFAEVMNGSTGPDGKRRSIFRKGPTGEPVLLERLRARHAENLRDLATPGKDPFAAPPSGDVGRGMPLGLPALSPEDFALVERWVRGGRPAPKPGAARDDEAGPMVR